MGDRIAIYLPSLNGGGAERVLLNIANKLGEKGYNVSLVLAKAEGPFLNQVSPRVSIVDLHSTRVLYSIIPLIRYLKKNRPKILLSALNYVNIIAILATILSKNNNKVIISEHSTLGQEKEHYINLRQKIIPILMKIFYPFADLVIAVSQGVADDLIKETRLSRSKIKVIYNPIVTEELLIKRDASFSHPWFSPNNPPVILSIGRLTEAKDFPTLFRAFAKVHKKIEVRLIILGEGELREDLESLVHQLNIEKDVSLPGFVDNPYVYLKRASLFVLSSKWEGLPTVLVEAMACGCPVISTDCKSGPKEILESGKYGILVPVGDVDRLAEQIEKTLKGENDSAFFKKKEELMKRANDFKIENIIKEYEKILQKV